jgi:hypothetical protein
MTNRFTTNDCRSEKMIIVKKCGRTIAQFQQISSLKKVFLGLTKRMNSAFTERETK